MNINEPLYRQLEFIETSCQAYDAGKRTEAVRIATALRVLFHQTKESHAIINQLLLRDSIHLLSTFSEYNRKEGVITLTFGGLLSHQGVTPALDRANDRKMMSIDEWWEQIVHVQDKEEYSRKDVVLKAANEDGGTHLSPKPGPKIKGLRSGVGRFSTETREGRITTHDLCNTHFPLLRQFGHEVLNSKELVVASNCRGSIGSLIHELTFRVKTHS